MTKSKNTKKALFTSVISMMLCVTMLIGSTFAWFTDTATTNVNTIQAGTLDIAFMMKNADDEWVSAEGETLSFTNVDGETDILWEPGATFKLPDIKVVNNGNLALKFNLVINGVYGDLELADVLEVMINGNSVGTLAELMADADGAAYGIILPKGENVPEGADKAVTAGDSGEYKIALHMQETAGNKYQGMSLSNMTFTAFASQYTYEYDMTDDQYDAKAESVQGQNVIDLVAEGYTEVSTYEELKAAMEAGKNIVLAADITTSGNGNELNIAKSADVTLDLNGYTITHKHNATGSYSSLIHVDGDAKLTINDSALIGGITVTADSNNTSWGDCVNLIHNEGALVINGGHLTLDCSNYAWGYVVDNRPNAWSTAYENHTTFTLNGGVLNAGGEDAVRVAYNSSTKHAAKKSEFTMNGGTVIGYSAVFAQQLDNEFDAIIVNINAGTLDVSNYIFRAYGEGYTATDFTINEGVTNYTGNALVTRVTIGDDVTLCGNGASTYYVSTARTATMITVPSGLEIYTK